MPLIQTRLNKVGNVLVHEYKADRRYCRQNVTLTYATAGADDMEVGEVLVLDTGKYRELVAGDNATISTEVLAILIDDQIEEKIAADLALASPTGDVTVATLYRGPAAVKQVGLNTGAATEAGVFANLEAAGIDVLNKLSVRTASRLV